MIRKAMSRLLERAQKIFSELTTVFSRDRAQYARHRLGREAEERVTQHLRHDGYRILQRNFSCSAGEIDIIAFQDGVVVFVEVRSTTEPAQVNPLATITPEKRQRIIRAAHNYITLKGLRQQSILFRFDAVAVRYNSSGQLINIRHLEDAFEL